MSRFNFITTENTEYFEIKFKGEMIGLTDFEGEPFQKLTKQISKQAESRIVILDLNEVTMWDSEGMRQALLYLAHEINSKHGTRIYIVAPRNGYLFNRAKEKYKHVVDNTVPWIEDKKSVP
jgi:anti-anti-sigma regulatory factor